uniref:HAUS augmin-like complex subunit 2 n=1 Tax=Jaculus jaculus TaxID=51337 RepID=A0A8C5L390_JACJA
MAAANPWDPASAPNAAGQLLDRLVASGIVTEEMLNISKKRAPCFVNFSRQQQISDIQAEIYQKSLEIELLELEKDTADLVQPSYLSMVHLVELAVTFIERLETHLETIRNVPHLDASLKKM